MPKIGETRPCTAAELVAASAIKSVRRTPHTNPTTTPVSATKPADCPQDSIELTTGNTPKKTLLEKLKDHVDEIPWDKMPLP